MTRIIPMEDFFKNPEKVRLELSPGGNYLSWMEPWKSRMNVVVKNMVTGDIKRVTAATERSIYGYIWANDDRIIYVMDKGGDENTRLYGVNFDGSNQIEFTPYENVKCDIVDELRDDPEHIIFQMNKRNQEIFDIFRLNINTGVMTQIAENPGNVSTWMTDHDGKLRLATTIDGVNTGILYRKTEESEWKEIASYDFKEGASPLLFTFDNNSLFVTSNVGRDKNALFEYDLETGKEGKLLFEHTEVDVNYLMHSKKRKVLTGAYYVTDKRHFHFFDEFRKKIQDFMDLNFPEYENGVTSFDKHEKKCVFYSGSDRTYGTYYYLDLEKWEYEKLFDLAPWLNENELAEVKPIKYRSRDGLTINGYLTLPKGKEHKNLPVVINPHGGPWARDQWGFNPEIQFLVNRGYAVLQMNFRGSTGYGKKFWEASFKHWGLTMQEDITDSVNWIIEEGIADPKKIAIYGGSYGGYATLMGIVKDPDLYAAAIDYVGVSNMFTFLETIPPYWEQARQMFYEMIGDPVNDAEQFKITSPALNSEKIKTPLLVVQGANDPRVKKNESDQMVEALKKRGVEVEYIVKDNEGHGFYNEENRFDFYRAMEKFLEKHIR
jgi:dipeptidyl aminopeptidase/acylaminoacyl peptidase